LRIHVESLPIVAIRIGTILMPLLAAGCATAQEPPWYVYGHQIDPPYQLEAVDGAILLNGIQIYPQYQRTHSQTNYERPPLSASGRERIDRIRDVSEKVFSSMKELHKQNKDVKSSCAELAKNLRESEKALEAVEYDGGYSITVKWPDGLGHSFVFTPTGQANAFAQQNHPPEAIRSTFEMYKQHILLGDLVVVSSFGSRVSFPGVRGEEYIHDVRQEVQQARSQFKGVPLDAIWGHDPTHVGAIPPSRSKPPEWSGRYIRDARVAFEIANPLDLSLLEE